MSLLSLTAWRRLDPDVRRILFSSLLLAFTLFGGIYSVLLNLYLLRLGYGPQFVGAVNASGSLAFAAFSLLSGMLGRRWGNRRMIMGGVCFAVIGHGLLPLATGIAGEPQAYWLLGTFALGSIGMNMYFVNIFPFLMAKTQPQERNRIFSLQVAIWPLAAFSGALLGGFLPGWLAGLFNVAVGAPSTYGYSLALAAVVLIPAAIFLYRTSEGHEKLEAAKGRLKEAANPQQLKATKPKITGAARPPYGLILAMAGVTLFQTIGESVVRMFYNTYLDDALKLSTEMIGGLSASGQLLAVVAALSSPVLAARWDRGRIIAWGSVGIAGCLVPLALVPLWWAAGLSYMALIGMGALRRPVYILFQQELVVPAWRVTMSSAVAMAYGIGSSLIGLGGGYLIAGWGYKPFFLTGSTLVLVGVLLFWGYFMRGPRGEYARPAGEMPTE